VGVGVGGSGGGGERGRGGVELGRFVLTVLTSH